jgi:hypothetical protein
MKTSKALFSELMHDFQSERWNEFDRSSTVSGILF